MTVKKQKGLGINQVLITTKPDVHNNYCTQLESCNGKQKGPGD